MSDLRILDSTLRKGDEAPAAMLSTVDRLQIALALGDAGVDTIVAGFPAASPSIAIAVAEVARRVSNASVAAFARLLPEDVDLAWTAIKHAREPRLITGIALSDEHLNLRLKRSRSAAAEAIELVVGQCAAHCGKVTFVAEDATRADRDFLFQALERAVQAGADTLVIADTVGYSQPDEYAALIRWVRERVPSRVAIAAQCSDDLGLALANTLAAVRAGAAEIEVTVNGIGPRAGLCALEEACAALHVRAEYYDAAVLVRTAALPALSDLVSRATGMAVAPNKAVVGRNAFLHAAGAHQAAVLRRPSLYEVIPAQTFGRIPAELYFGRQSGRRALSAAAAHAGLPLTSTQLEAAYGLFLSIADHSPRVNESQLKQIASVIRSAIPEKTPVTDMPHDPNRPLRCEPRSASTIQEEFTTKDPAPAPNSSWKASG